MPPERFYLRVWKLIPCTVGTSNTNVNHGYPGVPSVVIPVVQGATNAYVTVVSFDSAKAVLKSSAASTSVLLVVVE